MTDLNDLVFDVLLNEDGSIWSAHVYGHHPLELLQSEPVLDRMIEEAVRAGG